MDVSVTPDWVGYVLPVAFWAAAASGIWLLFALLDYLNRRKYNLTVADRGGDAPSKPDFLSVDAEKREAAKRAGAVFDEKIAARDRAEAEAAAAPAKPTPATQTQMIAGVVTFVAAIIASISAIGRIEFYDAAIRRLSNWEMLVEVASAYWLGFLVVAAMIAVQIYMAVKQVQSD